MRQIAIMGGLGALLLLSCGRGALTYGNPVLTIDNSGPGPVNVRATGYPDQICNGGAVCEYPFDRYTTVSLLATELGGSVFYGWSGDSGTCTRDHTCDLEVVADRTVYADSVWTLDVELTGQTTDLGRITSTDGVIDCPGTCEADVGVRNPEITLQVENGLWFFYDWSSPCSPADAGTCTISMDAPYQVGARFELVKLDGYGSLQNEGVHAVAPDIDVPGAYYAAGSYSSGNLQLSKVGSPLPYTGGTDFFVARFDEYGQPTWIHTINGTGSGYPHAITTDLTGNVFVVGSFSGEMDLDRDGTPEDPNADPNGFALKINENGVVWQKFIDESTADAQSMATSVAYHPVEDAVFISGIFQSEANFDVTGGDFDIDTTNNNRRHMFVWRLEAADGAFGFATSIGRAGAGETKGTTIAVAADDEIVVAGPYEGDLTTINCPAMTLNGLVVNSLVAKMSRLDGTCLGQTRMDLRDQAIITDMVAHTNDRIYVAGVYLAAGGGGERGVFVREYDTSVAVPVAGWTREFISQVPGAPAIELDTTGASPELALTGSFAGNINFGILQAASGTDLYSTTLDIGLGNVVDFRFFGGAGVEVIGGPEEVDLATPMPWAATLSGDVSSAVTVLPNGIRLVAGHSNSTTFDVANAPYQNAGLEDTFLLRIAPAP